MIFRELETDRLVLKNIGYEDIPFIYKEFSTDEVNMYLFDAEPVNSDEEAKRIIDFYVEPEPRNQHRWIIILKENNEKVGTCGFHCWNTNTHEVELGYDLQPDYWRNGYMSEALAAILAFSKNEMRTNRVIAHIYPDNIASVNTAKKAGFVRTGKQYLFIFRGEKYLHDIYLLEQ
jgi:ribosomal-protein-alanine N-acetyltransferase